MQFCVRSSLAYQASLGNTLGELRMYMYLSISASKYVLYIYMIASQLISWQFADFVLYSMIF